MQLGGAKTCYWGRDVHPLLILRTVFGTPIAFGEQLGQLGKAMCAVKIPRSRAQSSRYLEA
jgi:hypothetical protein